MAQIITLTVNPAIDKSTTVAGMSPNTKLRCAEPSYDAGGGGINVSRAIRKLGGTSLCSYFAGGPTGEFLKKLLTEQNIEQSVIPIEGWTRENLAVTDTTTNQQYRFGMPGPPVKEVEWKSALTQLEQRLHEGDYLVASGKLPPHVPEDFYLKVGRMAEKKEVRFILDTSGEALMEAAKSKVYMLKPNLAELGALCGVASITDLDLKPLAQQFLERHDCEVLVVSLGPKGALLATKNTMEQIPAPVVHQKSTIGAGDSMVAGMVMSLIWGKPLSDMVRYGVACGTAATMHHGTQLCHKEDADRLYDWIKGQKPI
ncbi:1-phosphofructokinase family hexose kinase [Zobellia galactanivorans]|uniref:1-phosphofructokinase family hexose kinase n=1 Tax=Zobellia TaxID=112040 RepID=UPI000B531F10|nr:MULTISPECIES: 1-phosphofructokinase family hexose kinase [Zobellia]MBU3024507.1 1-phosphofructokinase family hexose kinase [Zobellia galactanivorans]MDO6807610.1 1-phosphofructokinase family hexose kinase [Zobellia galactanivorans]OWW25421.1 phosphofructokinase [Zobellia sp. OII3]